MPVQRVRVSTVAGLVTPPGVSGKPVAHLISQQMESQFLSGLNGPGYVTLSLAVATCSSRQIDRTHERRGPMVTTNLPCENRTEALAEERLIGALLDRLACRLHVITFPPAPSYFFALGHL